MMKPKESYFRDTYGRPLEELGYMEDPSNKPTFQDLSGSWVTPLIFLGVLFLQLCVEKDVEFFGRFAILRIQIHGSQEELGS